MKTSCALFVLFSIFSQLSLQADSNIKASTTQPDETSSAEINQLATELLAPFKDGLQLEDLIIVTSILDTYFTKNTELSLSQKRVSLQAVLEKMINSNNFSSSEKFFLHRFSPALAFIIFPSSIDETLYPSINPSASEQNIVKAINDFVIGVSGGISWNTIPSCILFACHFSASYSDLNPQERACLSKKILGDIIDKTDTPYLPDLVFDEIFKRISYPLIDYVLSKK